MTRSIVVLEDDPAIAVLLQFALESPELQVFQCHDGQEGLETIQKQQPDLVICDVKMPGLSGWEVFDTVRADDALKETPIIMLSVSEPEGDRRDAFQRGSKTNAYIGKPFDVMALRRKLIEFLGDIQWQVSDTPARPRPGREVQSIGAKLKQTAPTSDGNTASAAVEDKAKVSGEKEAKTLAVQAEPGSSDNEAP